MKRAYATEEATLAFAKCFSNYKEFYKKHNGLIFSKLGFGTFKKEPYKEENYLFDYKEALKCAIGLGINVIDTALNYRYQQSEREIGEALSELFEEGKVSREALIICSKGGFIPLDFPFPKNPYEWINEHIIQKKLAKPHEIELDQHCMSTAFLEDSLHRSLKNLRVECLDIYFLHNPETQLHRLGKEAFLKEIKTIFTWLEGCVEKGLIRSYGVAVWNAFFYEETNAEHINLEALIDIALRVGGEKHHFRYIQAPFNLAKTHAYSAPTQKMRGVPSCTLLRVAEQYGLGVIGSASLLQMHLFKKPFKPEVGYLLDTQMQLKSDVQLALQFVRSTKGLLTSLFSSTQSDHVKSNVDIARIPATTHAKYALLYKVERS